MYHTLTDHRYSIWWKTFCKA